MSDSILDHGYVPEEHAPDPVISHGDPTPPGKIGIWLFLASEIMFFIAILATYIIFRSGSPTLFAEHAEALSKSLAGVNTLVLIFSSLTMALAVDAAHKGLNGRVSLFLGITLACAATFMVIKYVEYKDKLTHYTIVATEVDPKTNEPVAYVYDGHVKSRDEQTGAIKFEGIRARIETPEFNIGWISQRQVVQMAQEQHRRDNAVATVANGVVLAAATASAQAVRDQIYTIPADSVAQALTYGPWKNIFYACYFTLTGVHGLHVVGGMVALGLLLAQSLRGKIFGPHTEYVGLYWHLVDLVWIFLFPLLYLI